MKIKLGKGGKPLMVGGKVVTNCSCCGGVGGPCWTANNLSVQFSGVLFNCGCVLVSPSANPSVTVTSNILNGTFTVPKTSSGTGFSSYSLTVSSMIAQTEWGDSADCSTSGGSNSRDGLIIVYCTDGTNGDPAGTYVTVSINYSLEAAFYAHDPLTGITSLSNEFSCAERITDAEGFDGIGVAHAGSVAITPL